MIIWIPIALAVMFAMAAAAGKAVLDVMDEDMDLARKPSMVPPRSSYAP